MQQLSQTLEIQQLPRAQRFFKSYVTNQAEKLIEHSHILSKKYLTEREELMKKLSDTSQKKKEVRRTLSLLSHVLELPERLRDEIQEVRGMTTSQILDLLKQYQDLDKQYELEQEKGQDINDPNETKAQISNSNIEEKEHSSSSQEHQASGINKPKWIRLALASVETVCCTSAILAVLYHLLF